MPEIVANLAGEGLGSVWVRAAIRNLQRWGLIVPHLVGGSVRIRWAPGQRFLREAILAAEGVLPRKVSEVRSLGAGRHSARVGRTRAEAKARAVRADPRGSQPEGLQHES